MFAEITLVGIVGYVASTVVTGCGDDYTYHMGKRNSDNSNKKSMGVVLVENTFMTRTRDKVFGYTGQVIEQFTKDHVRYRETIHDATKNLLDWLVDVEEITRIGLISSTKSDVWKYAQDRFLPDNNDTEDAYSWMDINKKLMHVASKDYVANNHRFDWRAPFQVRPPETIKS
jgi:hypothetical protein|tara:strand:+ start:1059 stop:1574 length:516 start_codon:yes stop_codon:yes gene_type:complete